MTKRAPLILSLALAGALSAPGVLAQTFAGPYLAATQADMRNDYVEASRYYALALIEAFKDPELLQRAMVTQLGAGDYDTALVIARQIDGVGAGNSLTNLLRFGDQISRGRFEEAQALISSEEMDINVLLKGLLQGWAAVGQGDYARAEAAFDALQANESLLIYG
ncbi:MAG: hypothetical protein AAFR93_13210, partial [Pseudomonadota bacterium]